MKNIQRYIILTLLLCITACNDAGSLGPNPDVVVKENAFTITDSDQLIGGPLAQGRVGDMLLSNDKISVIIQQQSKYAQACPFGGVIIDADIKRSGAGQDNFGKMCPLVNIEWTVDYYDFKVLRDGADGGAKKLRAFGHIDVLDYLDLDFIAPIAKALTDQTIYYSPRMDDAMDPFSTYDDLKGMSIEVITDYTLEPGKNYVKIETTYENNGDEAASFPIGQFVNGSGQVQTLVPKQGFTPQPTAQITGDTNSIIYVPFQGVDVSYGYFYDVHQFYTVQNSAVDAQKMLTGVGDIQETERIRNISTSLTYSGVSGVLLGEEFLNLFPLAGPDGLKINFRVPPQGTKTVTEYLAVGDSNAGSVFDAGLKALDIPTRKISGKVVDEDGIPVSGATVVIQDETNMTVIVYRTKSDGSFSGSLSTGVDSFAQAFGKGKYNIFVDKEGYHKSGTNVAGTCTPSSVDVTVIDQNNIKCTLGFSGTVEIAGAIVDKETKENISARLTIVGFDPSPDLHAGAEYATTHGAGNFEDTWIFERPWGIMDVKYINAKGGVGLDGPSSFKLEPGEYAFVFSHGIEYDMVIKNVTVSANSNIRIENISLKRLIKTPGWISADFHLHSIPSPDSGLPSERRGLAAIAEGMDVLQSSDHDWLVDYGPIVKDLEEKGIIPEGKVATIIGDEISPNHYGHMNVFPLVYDKSEIDGGALDWTYSKYDTNDPFPDFVMSPRDIIDYYNSGNSNGLDEMVLQMNHISDQATSLLIVSSWVTTTAYMESYGVAPLSSYVEPSAQRIKPIVSTKEIPTPFGTSDLVVPDFTAIELTIGPELYSNLLRESGLPQWFNLLNLGILATATGDSDSHRETVDQLGMPRNYVASEIDPRDGEGSFSEFDKSVYAKTINEHKVVVSAGPFISMTAEGEEGTKAGVGGLVKGHNVTLHVDVKSPWWAYFDTVEIYTNTAPLPADDDGVSVFKGVASDPKSFFAAYHIPRFYYEPDYIYSVADKSLANWTKKDGVISVSIDVPLKVDEDTWVVAFVHGDPSSENWRSLFPFVTKSVPDLDHSPDISGGWTIEGLASDPSMSTSAWGFTNPIYIDTDGDTNNDGNPFEALYVKSGISPIQ